MTTLIHQILLILMKFMVVATTALVVTLTGSAEVLAHLNLIREAILNDQKTVLLFSKLFLEKFRLVQFCKPLPMERIGEIV